MESKRGRISGSGNWLKRSGNAKEEDKRSSKIAGTQKCQRSAKVPGPRQLLQEVYKGLHQNSCTTTCAGQKGAEIEIEKGTEESV